MYEILRRDKSKSRVERNEIMIENFQKILLKNLEKSYGGYFFKRKSYYFDRKDKIKSNVWSGLLSKIGSVKYDKRYFHLDINSQTLSYGKD